MTFVTRITSTDTSQPVGFEIWIDNDRVLDLAHVDHATDFAHTMPDVDGDHVLKFVLKNKLPEHTKIDGENNIVADVCVNIEYVKFDDIDVTPIIMSNAEYEHDYNGTQSTTKQRFYGTMGCNGTVSVPFSTPIYLWVIEKI